MIAPEPLNSGEGARSFATLRAPILLLALLGLAAGCATGGGGNGAGSAKPKGSATMLGSAPADSATVLVWHLDEPGGTRILDGGAHSIDARGGIDTTPQLGRVLGARKFTRSVDSFIYAQYQPAIETPERMTIEAWVRLDAFGQYEDTPIAMRWNPRVDQKSWLFAVGGLNLLPPTATLPGPADHAELMQAGLQNRAYSKLIFAFMPGAAGAPRTFFSNQSLELSRWTHVAATYDGKTVRFYIDGQLDSQFAASGPIRSTAAPLLAGNAFDARLLTTSEGDLRVSSTADHNPYYALQGTLDELRLSSVARTEFPYVR